MAISDKRGKKINEIITGIKIIKFNGWEKLMNNLTLAYREKEGKLILKAFLLYNFSQAVSSFIPTIMGLVIFSTYEIVNGKKLRVSQIYELITLFNGVLMPIQYYIMSMMGRAEALAACDRINAIIQVDNYEPLEDDQELENGEIEVKDACFNWEDPRYYKLFENKDLPEEKLDSYILKNINLRIKKGEFIAIVGKVGSGKSSLLLALMNEMVKHRGSVRKNGAVAFVSQETFLQNASIKENVIFGCKFNKEKFDKILKICQMETDLDILPGREETEIGERGINLSGGQKQRINIARAVYSNSDIYLIDDALSALDAYVGKKIMNLVFKKELKGKTRVMVTHYLHLLDQVDKVVLVDSGEIKAFGTYDEIRKMEVFKKFAMAEKEEIITKEDGETLNGEEKEEESQSQIENSEIKEDKDDKDDKEDKDDILGNLDNNHKLGINNNNNDDDDDDNNEVNDDDNMKKESILIQDNSKILNTNTTSKEEKGKLTKEEKRNTGQVGIGVFFYYFSKTGKGLTTFVFLFYFLVIAAKMGCDWWVGQWMGGNFNLDDKVYFSIYILLSLFAFICAIYRAFSNGYMAQRGAVRMFRSIVWNILRRPMSFFDTTPSGVIINRCTSDVNELDYTIPWFLGFFSNIFFNFIGVFILTMVASPTTIIFIFIAFALVYRNFKIYLITAIELKRMVQMGNSPVISITSEFIEGATIIRNYGKSARMLEKFEKKADLYHSSYFHNQRVNVWMRAKIELLLTLVVACTVFSIVVNKEMK